MIDRLTGLHADPAHHHFHALAAEQSHEIVVHRNKEFTASGVSLTSGTAAQLIVDAPAFVTFGADDVQSARSFYVFVIFFPLLFFDFVGGIVLFGRCIRSRPFLRAEFGIASELDIGTAAGHIRCDRHRALCTRFGYDERFARVIFCVQHFVADSPAREHRRKVFRFFYGNGTDEYGLPLCVSRGDFVADRRPLVAFVEVDFIVFVFSDNRLIRRNRNDIEFVNFIEFDRFRRRRSGHAGKLVVHAEKILKGDRRKRSVPLCDAQMLFRFDRLMQPVAVAPAFEDTAGKFVDDLHLPVFDKVIDVVFVQAVSPYRLRKIVHVFEIIFIEDGSRYQIVLMENCIDVVHTRVGKRHALRFFIERVIAFDIFPLFRLHVHFVGIEPRDGILFHFDKLPDIFIDFVILVRVVFALPADDKRRARFVDQNRVDFVDDTKAESALHFLRKLYLHIVAEIIETEFVVRPVGDVAVVRRFPCSVVHIRKDRTDGLPHVRVHGPHPFGIAPCEVVVYRNDMHALSRKAVQIGGRDAHERFTFARFHFGNAPRMQHERTHDLHVVGAFAQHAERRFARERKSFGKYVVERFAFCKALFKNRSLFRKIFRRKGFCPALFFVHFCEDRSERFDISFVLRAEEKRKYLIDKHTYKYTIFCSALTRRKSMFMLDA